jgi:hypothetical protein
MDSSFLSLFNISLGLFALFAYVKMLIQFGLPNHPARLTSYLVSFCVVAYFFGASATDLELISVWDWLKWRPLPLVAGGLGLLLQTLTTMGNFSLIQQKVISRIPVIAALLCFAFFPSKAELFVMASVIAGGIFLTVLVGKARYQKRLYFKMVLFLSLFQFFSWIGNFGFVELGHIMLFFGLFYFFLFQQTFGIAALMDKGVQ